MKIIPVRITYEYEVIIGEKSYYVEDVTTHGQIDRNVFITGVPVGHDIWHKIVRFLNEYKQSSFKGEKYESSKNISTKRADV